MHKTKIIKPIFMIGMGRSGTSVFSEAITLHEDIGWFSIYLEKFPFCPWLAVLDRICTFPGIGLYLRGKKRQGKGVTSSIRRYLPRFTETFSVWKMLCGEEFAFDYLIEKTASRKDREQVLTYIQKVLNFQGKKRFFAKFTGPPRICYLNSIFPDAYYIHVIRDPRAVVSSLLNVKFWREGGGLKKPWWRNGLPDAYIKEWEDSGRSSAALAAVQWKRVVELTWEESALLSAENYVQILYEDFVKNPLHLLRTIFNNVGLNESPSAEKYLSSIGKLHNMNFKYKENLDAGEIALVEKITCETAMRAGYDF